MRQLPSICTWVRKASKQVRTHDCITCCKSLGSVPVETATPGPSHHHGVDIREYIRAGLGSTR